MTLTVVKTCERFVRDVNKKAPHSHTGTVNDLFEFQPPSSFNENNMQTENTFTASRMKGML